MGGTMISVPTQPKTLLEELQAKILARSGSEKAPGCEITQTPAATSGQTEHFFYSAEGATSVTWAEPEYSKH